MPKITLKNLSYSIKDKKSTNVILDDINISFPSFEISAILGNSGGGKTTLLRCISGLIDKYDGNIFYDNECVDGVPVRYRHLSYVTQNFSLYPHMTIFDSIAYPLKLIGASKEEILQKVYDIAQKLDILPILSRKPKQVSLGQLQRASIARALIKRPEIALFDEPLSNLDQQNSDSIRPLLKKVLHDIGTTVIYVTHDINEATSISDNLYILENGKFIISGKTKLLEKSNNKLLKPYFKQ